MGYFLWVVPGEILYCNIIIIFLNITKTPTNSNDEILMGVGTFKEPGSFYAATTRMLTGCKDRKYINWLQHFLSMGHAIASGV